MTANTYPFMRCRVRALSLCVFLLGLLLSTATIVSAADTPNTLPAGADVYKRYIESNMPVLDQFRVSLKADWNGQRVGSGTIGWTNGLKATATLSSPFLGPLGNINLALRPSGFVLLKTNQGDQVLGNLAPYGELLALLPKIANRQFITDIMSVASGNTQVVGTTTVDSRTAFILEIQQTPEAYAEALTNTARRVLENPELRTFLEETADVTAADIEDAVAKLPGAITEATKGISYPPMRMYIDTQDYVFLGYDAQTWAAYERIMKQAMQAEGYPDFPLPKFEVTNFVIGKDGHIASYNMRFRWDMTAGLMQQAAATAQKEQGKPGEQVIKDAVNPDEIFMMMDLSVQMKRTTTMYLPAQFDAAVMMNFGIMNTGDEKIPFAPRQEHTISLTLAWDLTKGADTKLIENSKLITAEKSWAEAEKNLLDGDYEAAIAPLERLTAVAPTFADAFNMLSQAYMFTGRSYQAVQMMERLLELDPENIWLANNLAYTYVEDEIDVVRGLEIAEDIQAQVGDDMPGSIYDTLAWALYKNKRYEEAEAAATKAVALCKEEGDDDLAVVYYHLAMVLYAEQKFAAAKEAINCAIESEPDDVFSDLLKQIEQKLAGK